MQRNQVPTAAKIRFLETAVRQRKELIPIQGDPTIAKEMGYQIEVLEAMLDDYKQKAKVMTSDEYKQSGREFD